MLGLLTRILLWACIGVVLWFLLRQIIPEKYLAWLAGTIVLFLLIVYLADPNDATISAIWKILSFPLTPLGAAIILLASALSEGGTKARGRDVAIALTILLLASIPLSAQWLVSGAERSVRNAFIERSTICEDTCRIDQVPGGNLGEAAAIVVLGESSDIDKALNVAAETSDEVSINTVLAPRLIYAASLYDQARRRNANPIVVVTAGASETNSDENNVIRDILSNNNVPLENIRIETTGLNVRSTGVAVEKLLESRQVIAPNNTRQAEGVKDDPRVVLVAPALVISRAALSFEKMNLQVIAKPTDFNTARFSFGNSLLAQLPELLPSVDALQLTTKYWNELLTSFYYFLRGWLPNFNFGWDPSIEI